MSFVIAVFYCSRWEVVCKLKDQKRMGEYSPSLETVIKGFFFFNRIFSTPNPEERWPQCQEGLIMQEK